MAGELALGIRAITLDDVAGGAVAVIVAAGGEESAGLDAIVAARRMGAPVILVGGNPSHRVAVEALRRGADDYFALPGDISALRRALAALAERADAYPLEPDTAFRALVGNSPVMREVIARARRVMSHREVTVLIGGETGTGKELLAHALHQGGPRSGGPFVAVNCAAIPAQLLESELFGHERGAFTDARDAKPGLFEAASGGTMLLDEIGHLPMALQGKLLRALETRHVRRVGATEDRRVDVRFIAATHADLLQAVRQGEFREDLYYRLNVVALTLPPLRERGEDIDLLARHILSEAASRYGLPTPPFTPAVRAALRRHTWPGNVRELRHAIERAVLLSPPGSLDLAELLPAEGTPAAPGMARTGTVADILYNAVQSTLTGTNGNKSEAARQLGISRTRLMRILARDTDA
ncbi:MAG: sigma-54 dependent transcriptional regulator [Gemmatimonadales bacterium]